MHQDPTRRGLTSLFMNLRGCSRCARGHPTQSKVGEFWGGFSPRRGVEIRSYHGASPFMTPPPRPESPPIDEKNSNQCSRVDDLSNKILHLMITITPFLKGLVDIYREISKDDCDFDFGAIAFIARKSIRWIRNVDLIFTKTTGVLKSLDSLSHRIRAQGPECEKRGRFQHTRTTTTNGKEVGFEPE